ncbi:MAG: hypothetical protein EBU05_04620 [Chitinophagia bacterium]|nr:hypothetical protein [Chitinophagia bacterium]
MDLFLIPILTGLFGWLLIWLSAKSLFYPTKAIQIGGFTWESNLSHLIHQFPIDLLIPKESESEASFMFIGDKTVAQLKSVFLEELASIFPQLIGQFAQNAKMNMSKSLATKLADTLAPIVMKSIKPIQWGAFVLGICWGGLIVFFLHSF